MKTLKILIFIFAITTLSTSCENNETTAVSENGILGVWTAPKYEGDITTFIKVNDIPENHYSINFKSDLTLIEKTSGFCGTPPLSFFDVDGTYTLDENIINIKKQSFPTEFSWQIISLTATELKVKRVFSEQEKDHQHLMDLFTEIENLAYSESCINQNDWTFVGYGSKACGGVQGYIAYSKKINVVGFLTKIKAYSDAEKAYNIKWGIASTCDITLKPKKVECINNFPTLIY